MTSFFNKHYDTLMGPLENKMFPPVRKRLLQHVGGTVLEIGSGTGINFNYYHKADRVFAIEPDSAMLEKSLKRAKGAPVSIQVMQSEAERLPFDTDFFDCVVGTLVFCTIPDPHAALKEIHRVCKPGGKVLLFEHVRMQHPLWGRLQDLLTPAWKRLCGGCHLNRNTVELIEQEGFRITRREWMYNKLFVVMEATNDK